MTVFILMAVLGAALLHAAWNAVVKTGSAPLTGMLMMSLWQSIIGFAIVLWRPMPGAEVWPWIIASALIHMFYQLFLAFAYEKGDLSRVYPLARGAAPMIVLVVGAVVLTDVLSGAEVLGILILGAGIALMAGGVFADGENRRLVPLALGSACATAGYTLVDGMGARISGDPVTYVAWLLLLAGVFFVPALVALKGRGILRVTGADWGRGAAAAAASLASYLIAVWAMTQAPIALVAALRETSILFAVLIGWLVFGERMQRSKAVAAIVIVAGIVLTRV